MDKLASQILQSLANSKYLPEMLAGGGAGILGGALPADTPQRPGESAGGRRWRILRNALLSGGAGAGAVALARTGQEQLTTALPAGDKDPVVSRLTSPTARGVDAAAGGLAANWSNILGRAQNKAQGVLAKNLGELKILPKGSKLTAPMLNDSQHGPAIRGAMERYFQANGHDLDAARKATQTELLASGLPSHLDATTSDLANWARPRGWLGRQISHFDEKMSGPAGNSARALMYRLFGKSVPRLAGGGMAPILKNVAGVGIGAMLPSIIQGSGNMLSHLTDRPQ